MRLLRWIALAVAGILLCCQVAAASDITITMYITVAPTVTSSTATDITHYSGLVHGAIADTGGQDADTRGFEWGNSTGNYTDSWNETGSYGVGAFSYTVGNLTVGETVFWRAFATNIIGTGYSSEGNFTTLTLPYPPTNFKITQIGVDSANITWDMGVGADNIIIRGSFNGYPFSPLDGSDIYSGNGTWVLVNGLNLDTTVYYYRAWSENSFGYSEGYAQAKIGREGGLIGGNMDMLIFILPLGFAGFYLWRREMWQGVVSCICWLGVGIYYMTQSAATSPLDFANGDLWLILFWISVMVAIGFGFAVYSWKPSEWFEETEDDETYMAEYVKGKRTGKTRSLTDLEERERQEKTKEVSTRPRASRFNQTGMM